MMTFNGAGSDLLVRTPDVFSVSNRKILAWSDHRKSNTYFERTMPSTLIGIRLITFLMQYCLLFIK